MVHFWEAFNMMFAILLAMVCAVALILMIGYAIGVLYFYVRNLRRIKDNPRYGTKREAFTYAMEWERL